MLARVFKLACVLAGAHAQLVCLENSFIKVCIDPSRGGSISYLSAAQNTYNVINAHDMGREIQLSFYSGPDPYDPAHCPPWMGQPWPWNPIGAGDIDGNHGEVLTLTSTATSIHIITRPLQWACHNVSCECTFEQHLYLDGTAVNVTATLHNARSDTTAYPAQSQELPAAYSIGDLYRLFSYTGTAPWTNDNLTEFKTGGPPWVPGAFSASERWAAFVNKDLWGFGVYNPEQDTFLGGFHGSPGGGPSDDSTGYIAPSSPVQLLYNTNYTFTFAVVLGDLPTIRSYVYGKQAAVATAARAAVLGGTNGLLVSPQ